MDVVGRGADPRAHLGVNHLMKTLPVLLVLVTAAAAATRERKPLASTSDAGVSQAGVRGKAIRVTETHPCMGGAAVTEDMIQRDTELLVRQVFTVFAGNDLTGKVVGRLRTDENGQFSTGLSPGQYCLALGVREQVVVPPPSKVATVKSADPYMDADCLERLKYPTTCDATLVVPADARGDVEVVVYSSNQCSQAWAHPCWRGPMPP